MDRVSESKEANKKLVKNYKDTIQKELDKVQNKIQNEDTDNLVELENNRDFLNNKLNNLESEYENLDRSSGEEESKYMENNLYRIKEDVNNGDLVATGLSDSKAEDVLNSVIGQMSDGIWENSSQMNKYWTNADIVNNNGELYIKVNRDIGSGYYNKSDEEVRKFFANKVKQIAKEYIKDYENEKSDLKWDRNCTENCSYLDYHSGATIQDAYRVYDKLLGRIDRIKTEGKLTKKLESSIYTIPDTNERTIEYNNIDDLMFLADAIIYGIESWSICDKSEIVSVLEDLGYDVSLESDDKHRYLIVDENDNENYIACSDEYEMESVLDSLIDLFAQYVDEDVIIDTLNDNEAGLEVIEESKKLKKESMSTEDIIQSYVSDVTDVVNKYKKKEAQEEIDNIVADIKTDKDLDDNDKTFVINMIRSIISKKNLKVTETTIKPPRSEEEKTYDMVKQNYGKKAADEWYQFNAVVRDTDKTYKGKKVKTEAKDDLSILVQDIYDWYDSDMGTSFDVNKDNDTKNVIYTALKNKDVEEIQNIKDIINEFDYSDEEAKGLGLKTRSDILNRLDTIAENKGVKTEDLQEEPIITLEEARVKCEEVKKLLDEKLPEYDWLVNISALRIIISDLKSKSDFRYTKKNGWGKSQKQVEEILSQVFETPLTLEYWNTDIWAKHKAVVEGIKIVKDITFNDGKSSVSFDKIISKIEKAKNSDQILYYINWLDDEDLAKELKMYVSDFSKDIDLDELKSDIIEMIKESNKKVESKKTETNNKVELKDEVKDKINKSILKYFIKLDGEEEGTSFVKDYIVVETWYENMRSTETEDITDKYLVAEVRAELNYESLMNLGDELNKVISKYDKDAYFDAITSGIIRAYIKMNDNRKVKTEVKDKTNEDRITEIAKEIIEIPIIKKHILDHTWLSGSSTKVYPVSTYLDTDGTGHIDIQLDTKRNYFDNMIQQIKDKYSEIVDGWFDKTDDSCPANLEFKYDSKLDKKVKTETKSSNKQLDYKLDGFKGVTILVVDKKNGIDTEDYFEFDSMEFGIDEYEFKDSMIDGIKDVLTNLYEFSDVYYDDVFTEDEINEMAEDITQDVLQLYDDLPEENIDRETGYANLEVRYASDRNKKTEAVGITPASVLNKFAKKYNSKVDKTIYGDSYVNIAKSEYKDMFPNLQMVIVEDVKELQEYAESLGFTFNTTTDVMKGTMYSYTLDNLQLDIDDRENTLIYTVYCYNKDKKTETKSNITNYTDDFNSEEFENKIPRYMRWKHWSKVNHNDLYWVTQQFFNESDIKEFVKAFGDTSFSRAYVTVRDLSTYDYDEDYNNKVFVVIDSNGNYDMTDYINACKKDNFDSVLYESVDTEQVKVDVEQDIQKAGTKDMIDTENELLDGIKKEIYQYTKQQGLDLEKLRKQGIELDTIADTIDKVVGDMVSKSAIEFMNQTGQDINWDFEIKDNDIHIVWNNV